MDPPCLEPPPKPLRPLGRAPLGLRTPIIMRHLEPRPPKPALYIEALVGLAAVEDALVAADLLCDVVEGLDDAQAELLALLVLCDGDVLDVADET